MISNSRRLIAYIAFVLIVVPVFAISLFALYFFLILPRTYPDTASYTLKLNSDGTRVLLGKNQPNAGWRLFEGLPNGMNEIDLRMLKSKFQGEARFGRLSDDILIVTAPLHEKEPEDKLKTLWKIKHASSRNSIIEPTPLLSAYGINEFFELQDGRVLTLIESYDTKNPSFGWHILSGNQLRSVNLNQYSFSPSISLILDQMVMMVVDRKVEMPRKGESNAWIELIFLKENQQLPILSRFNDIAAHPMVPQLKCAWSGNACVLVESIKKGSELFDRIRLIRYDSECQVAQRDEIVEHIQISNDGRILAAITRANPSRSGEHRLTVWSDIDGRCEYTSQSFQLP